MDLRCAATALACLGMLGVVAQRTEPDSTRQLGDVVITGQYRPGSPEAAVHRLQVVDAQQIRRMAANNLGDALRNQLNIRLSQDNVLGSSLSMQGLGGENVKVLIDGVPVVGRTNGNIDLSQIDLTGIDRIELVEGPLSVNYGTNALAGTINLITRKSKAASATLRASSYAEHIGRLNTTVSASRRWGRNELLISAGRNFFAGWDPAQSGLPSFSPHIADTTRAQQWKPREQFFGRANYRWRGEAWVLGYKAEALHDRIIDRGKPRAPYYEQAFDAAYVTRRLDNALFAERAMNGGRLFKAQAAYNYFERTRNTWLRDLTDLDQELSQAPGTQDTVRFGLANVRATFASAPDSARITYEAGVDLNHEQGRGDRIGAAGREIGDYAVFASAELRFLDGLIARPGLRVAYNTRYESPLLPSINLRWRNNGPWTFRASYAQGFRAPSLKELYMYFVDVNHDITGNAQLQAERSESYAFNVNWSRKREDRSLVIDAGAYYNDVRDLITLARTSATSFTYANIGRLRTTGGQLNVTAGIGAMSVSGGVSMLMRKDALASEDDAWTSTPEVRMSITRTWERQGFSASFFMKHQGEQVSYAQALDGTVQRGTIGSFNLADATLTKNLCSKRLAVSAGCKDIFNVQNIAASMAGGIHDGGASSVPMTTGRTWFLRLELELARKA